MGRRAYLHGERLLLWRAGEGPMSGTTTRARRRAPVRELLTVAASAEYLGVCERTIRRMIHSGELKAYRIRRRGMIRIARADLDDLLSQVKPGDVQP